MTAPAAASAIPRRRPRPSIDIGTLALGEPIIIRHDAHATALDGAPWAAAGDRLLIGSGAALATVEVTACCASNVLRVWRASGELTSGDCRVMRAPVLPLDRRALVRWARLELVGTP